MTTVLARRFEGRAAIVTGASKGIGRATAMQLAREGAMVVINSRHVGDLEHVSAEIADAGGVAMPVAGDIRDDGLASRLVDKAIETRGRIDIVVNNATLSRHYGAVLEVDREAFNATVIGNCWPQLSLVQEAVRRGMGQSGPGAVVNISSIGPHNNNPYTAPYNAGKAAMEAVTATLAIELGSRGIRINVVAPGLVKTNLARAFWEDGLEQMEAAALPTRRIGQPEDIAQAVCFLASDESAWITGATLIADGGRMLLGGAPLKETLSAPGDDLVAGHAVDREPRDLRPDRGTRR
jgi:NAD(P)-dependent dehydrogenase (short-subunit alcohol dehydrogenase family)